MKLLFSSKNLFYKIFWNKIKNNNFQDLEKKKKKKTD